jgi:hypothetical protein
VGLAEFVAEMKALIYALFVLVWFGAMPARSEGTGSGTYEAYWLTNKARGTYVNLVLTRRPLSDLPAFSPPTNQPVSECDAVVVTTYARDSIWNVDQKPFKPLAGVENVETNSIVIRGETFTCTQADLEDVVRLLRNPMGTIQIHRIHGPLSGQEEPVRILAERLERQLADRRKARDQDGPANGSQPTRSGTNQRSSAAGSPR